jgi:hypothetical protein
MRSGNGQRDPERGGRRDSGPRTGGNNRISSWLGALHTPTPDPSPRGPKGGTYARICRPCFRTSASSFSAIPLGRLAPVSHFSTVLSLVLR